MSVLHQHGHRTARRVQEPLPGTDRVRPPCALYRIDPATGTRGHAVRGVAGLRADARPRNPAGNRADHRATRATGPSDGGLASGRHYEQENMDGSTTIRWRLRLLDYDQPTGDIKAELKSARFQLVV